MKPARCFQVLCLLLLLSLSTTWKDASAAATQPVVHGVLFYTTTCPYCREVMEEILPPLQEEYGAQLQIRLANIQEENGGRLYQNMRQTLSVPDERVGVPTLVVGKKVLVGSAEIREQLPGIIEKGLKDGGIALPPIPGLPNASTKKDSGTADKPQAPDTKAPVRLVSGMQARQLASWLVVSMQAKFRIDPAANSLIGGILLLMLASVFGLPFSFLNSRLNRLDRWSSWIVPGFVLFGLGVTTYLLIIATIPGARCSPLGSCNAARHGMEPKLFGLPVDLLYALAAGLILAAWFIQYSTSGKLRNGAAIGLWCLAMLQVILTIDLIIVETFLLGSMSFERLFQASLLLLTLWAATGLVKLTLQAKQAPVRSQVRPHLHPGGA